MSMPIAQVVSALGGESAVERQVNDAYDLIDLIKEGLPMRAVLQLQEKMGFSNKLMSSLLTISESTYQRRIKAKTTLTNDAAERVIGLSELYARGLALFGDDDTFRQWLTNSNFALGGRKPIDLLDTAIGRQEAADVLIRIEHGIFS